MPVALSLLLRARIIGLLEDGWTIRATAIHLNVNKNTILKLKRRWEQDGPIKKKVGTGRRKISNEQQDAALITFLRENPFEIARTAIIESNFPGSRSTVSRRIKETDLRNRVAAKKVLLSVEKKQARVIFALNNIYRDMGYWNKVIFTDEKIFQSTHNGHIRVYRPSNTRFDERYVSNTDRSGRFSVNVWAWISVHGLGVCWNVEERFTGLIYRDILENIMLPSVRQLFPNDNFVFQQDNCPIHNAIIVRNWFQANNIETMHWPSKSPDLNPIENIWGIMVKKMYDRNFRPQTRNELLDAILETWENLNDNANLLVDLYNSMPRRLNEVIQSDGSMIKY